MKYRTEGQDNGERRNDIQDKNHWFALPVQYTNAKVRYYPLCYHKTDYSSIQQRINQRQPKEPGDSFWYHPEKIDGLHYQFTIYKFEIIRYAAAIKLITLTQVYNYG